LTALTALRRERTALAAVALTVAVLSRETSLIVVAGFGTATIWELVRHRRWRWSALWLLLPVAVEAAWQGWLASVWGRLPILTGEGNTSFPLLGVLHLLLIPSAATGHKVPLQVVFEVERIAIVALLGWAGWLIVRRRSAVSAGEVCSWALAVLLAATVQTRNWKADVAFLRSTYEAWGLSVLVLLQASRHRDRRSVTVLLGGAALITAGVGLMYIALV
jgi:hypothetical protein